KKSGRAERGGNAISNTHAPDLGRQNPRSTGFLPGFPVVGPGVHGFVCGGVAGGFETVGAVGGGVVGVGLGATVSLGSGVVGTTSEAVGVGVGSGVVGGALVVVAGSVDTAGGGSLDRALLSLSECRIIVALTM